MAQCYLAGHTAAEGSPLTAETPGGLGPLFSGVSLWAGLGDLPPGAGGEEMERCWWETARGVCSHTGQ